MACSSISAITRICGSVNKPGVEKIWMVAYKDLYAVSGTDTFTVATSSYYVNAIGLTGSVKFVPVGILKDTTGFDTAGTLDPTKGTNNVVNTVTVKLSGLSVENRNFVSALTFNPVAILFKGRSGNYYVTGLGGLCELASFNATTGKTSADDLGYTLTFNEAGDIPYQVDPTLISSIVSA